MQKLGKMQNDQEVFAFKKQIEGVHTLLQQ